MRFTTIRNASVLTEIIRKDALAAEEASNKKKK
jgi:hypothetical protein